MTRIKRFGLRTLRQWQIQMFREMDHREKHVGIPCVLTRNRTSRWQDLENKVSSMRPISKRATRRGSSPRPWWVHCIYHLEDIPLSLKENQQVKRHDSVLISRTEKHRKILTLNMNYAHLLDPEKEYRNCGRRSNGKSHKLPPTKKFCDLFAVQSTH